MAKFLVIGLGKFGSTVASELFQGGADVTAIDRNKKIVEEKLNLVGTVLHMDSTSESSLRGLGIDLLDGVVLAVGNNIEVSLLTTMILKKLGAINIHVKVDSALHSRILEMIGVRNIIFPEEVMGRQLAQKLLSSSIVSSYNFSSDHAIVEVIAPDSFVGKTLQQLALPKEYGLRIIAIKSERFRVTDEGVNRIDQFVNDLPGANDVIRDDDVLVIMGSEVRIREMLRAAGSRETE